MNRVARRLTVSVVLAASVGVAAVAIGARERPDLTALEADVTRWFAARAGK